MWFRNDSYRKLSYNAMISVGITLLINTLIKLFYFKPRPFMKLRVGILTPSKIDSSFPSKHTLLAFALSTSVFLCERVLGSIMLVLSGLTGLSRIWVRHHYPSDVIGSALIGSVISIILEKNVWKQRDSFREKALEIVSSIIMRMKNKVSRNLDIK